MQAEILIVALGILNVTSYRSVPSQTDSTPYRTSINHRTHPFGVAVSPDMLASGEACYNDVLSIDGYGLRIVNDVMHPRHKRSIDLFVDTKKQEAKIGNRRLAVSVIKSPNRFCRKK